MRAAAARIVVAQGVGQDPVTCFQGWGAVPPRSRDRGSSQLMREGLKLRGEGARPQWQRRALGPRLPRRARRRPALPVPAWQPRWAGAAQVRARGAAGPRTRAGGQLPRPGAAELPVSLASTPVLTSQLPGAGGKDRWLLEPGRQVGTGSSELGVAGLPSALPGPTLC